MGMVGLRDVLVVAPAASFHRHDTLLPSASADHHPVIPLLADANARPTKPAATGIHFWQPQLHAPNPNPNTSMPYLRSAAGILAGAGTATCQDCGNQAKKDCVHHRCRTCCKSRGFDCSTHVKSTWVPAARRRERQQLSAAAAAGSSASTSAPKKPRLVSSQATNSHTSTSNTTPPRSFDTTSSHQDASFREGLPGHVRAPAVFKCVRVTSVDDGEDEFAYQAMVRIGGHVFKGFLYDQGVDDGRGGEQAHDSNSNNNAIPNISELHLGATGHNATTSSLPGAAGPSDIFGGSGALLGGTSYGNPMN